MYLFTILLKIFSPICHYFFDKKIYSSIKHTVLLLKKMENTNFYENNEFIISPC